MGYMQMAKGKLYRMPLSKTEMTEVELLDIEEEKRIMAKVCAGCSMRHILDPEHEVVELDDEGVPLTSYHIDCATKMQLSHVKATPLQFMQKGFSKEEAEKRADKVNNRRFVAMTEFEAKRDEKQREVNEIEIARLAENATDELEIA
jgi:hypothetical protein